MKPSLSIALKQSLPFQLTADQERAIEEIFSDIRREIPMNRLLEGDVGSGKTVVAAMAIYETCKSRLTSLLMAPTQILATQHFKTISTFLAPFGVHVCLVTGTQKPKGKYDVYVGTHALLTQSGLPKKVGLVVIDEQQRFGVVQRTVLSTKNPDGKTPHLLTMTATPIPRTVARVMFGNIDLSVLNQMPQGRIKIKTWVVPPGKRTNAYEWIKNQMYQTKGQVYIVCPFIEESETLLTVKAVKSEYTRLKRIFPEFSIGLLHGRMKPKEKDAALQRFRTQKDQILLATPVVEVGIDIPNAMIILVESAERFGLAQLHQLRGRVGRGKLGSYCLLFTDEVDELTLKRLKAMETIFSGPQLAEVDLTLRGPGQLFGTKQHGLPELSIASFTDTQTIEQTKKSALAILSLDPELTGFPLLRAKLKESKIQNTAD